jgi:hypothetical protein
MSAQAIGINLQFSGAQLTKRFVQSKFIHQVLQIWRSSGVQLSTTYFHLNPNTVGG